MSKTFYSQSELRYLKLLAKQYPTLQDASNEAIRLEAILNLPKGTEHFMSDIHGVNVKMKKIELSSLEVSVLADMHVADLAVYTNDQQFSYLTKGIYLDVLPLQSLNLSAPYWDQMIQEQLIILIKQLEQILLI